MADEIPWWDPFDVTDGKVFAPDSEGRLYDDTSPWASVTIAGLRLPGTCSVSGAAVHQIDIQRANGVDGGTLIERGFEPGRFDIDVKLWMRAHWIAWREIRPQIFRQPGKIDLNDAKTKKKVASTTEIEATAVAAHPISNSILDDAGIHACLIQSITMPRPGPEYGTWIITIKAIQYTPPTAKINALRKAVGSKDVVPLTKEYQKTVNKPKTPLEAGDGGPNGAPVTSGAPR